MPKNELPADNRILITRMDGGTVIDIKMDLLPHDAGHLIFKLMSTLAKGLQKSNPDRTLEECWEAIAEGLSCAVENGEAHSEEIPRNPN